MIPASLISPHLEKPLALSPNNNRLISRHIRISEGTYFSCTWSSASVLQENREHRHVTHSSLPSIIRLFTFYQISVHVILANSCAQGYNTFSALVPSSLSIFVISVPTCNAFLSVSSPYLQQSFTFCIIRNQFTPTRSGCKFRGTLITASTRPPPSHATRSHVLPRRSPASTTNVSPSHHYLSDCTCTSLHWICRRHIW